MDETTGHEVGSYAATVTGDGISMPQQRRGDSGMVSGT